MSLDLFRLIGGVDIQSDDISSNAYVLQGIGAPGADGGIQDDAPIGSIYMRTDAAASELQLYYKYADANSAADWRLVASKQYVDNAVQGISWRSPVAILDNTTYANLAAAEVVMNTGTMDGITVNTGDRVLLTDLTTGNENVYIITGTIGAGATFIEDANAASDGDALLVNGGSEADAQWIYDGTQWIKFGGAGSASELQFIRDFIGKDSAGAVTTDYPSNALVIDGQSLENEIGRLDHATGALTFTTPDVLADYSDNLPGAATGTITDNLQAIDDTFGDGTISPSGSNHVLADDMQWNVAGTLTITDAFDAINEGIGDRTYTNDFIVTDGQTIAGSIDALDTIVGDIDNTSAYTAGGFLNATTIAGNNIQETLDSFNQEIGDLNDDTLEITGGPTATSPTITVLDTISATEATEVKWMVQVKDAGGDRRAMEVHALTDGTTIDWTRYSVLRLGNTGSLGLDVVINGGNIELRISPANALEYTVKRISKSYLA